METKTCHATNSHRQILSGVVQKQEFNCNRVIGSQTLVAHAIHSLTQHSDTFTCYNVFPLQARKHLVWQNTAGLHLLQIQTGLHSASLLLAFGPNNRYLRTAKMIYEHSMQIKTTTYINLPPAHLVCKLFKTYWG